MPRMNILNKSEQAMFEEPPVFNSAERKRFFSFPNTIKEKSMTLRKPSTQIGFLLSCGYFKAAKKFFRPEDFHKNDIAYVARIFNFEPNEFVPEQYVQSTRQWHKDFILEFYGYRRFDNNTLSIIEHEISFMMRSQLKPKLIFWRCIDILIRERIQIPTYFQLSELILTAINQRKKELSYAIRQQLQPEIKSLLDGLFEQETDNPYARYKLTLLKKLSQSSKPTQIKERCSDLLYLEVESLRINFILSCSIFNFKQRRDNIKSFIMLIFIFLKISLLKEI